MARLTDIITRTGDDGTTGLVGGERVSKDSPRVWAYGTVDELNSAIGLARALLPDPALGEYLRAVQNDLFHLGAELATPLGRLLDGMPRIEERHIVELEKRVADWNAALGPLEEFILPGGHPAAAQLHVARTVCRRAERLCVRLAKTEPVGEWVIPYLNRLSDALFTAARWVNHRVHVPETGWRK
jgi:cob(I)alamin adenosyltransferase